MMIRFRTMGTAVLATGLLAMSACGGSTPSEETKDGKADTVSQEPNEEASGIDKYFELLDTNTEDSLKQAADLAAPGSVAATYATHLSLLASTDAAAGSSPEPAGITKVGDEFELCDLDGDGDPSDCENFSEFETEAGKLATFSAAGTPLKGRVVLGSGDSVEAGNLATVRFLSAYQSPFSDTLFVNLEVASKDQSVETGVGSADYRRPDGRQVTSSNYQGDYQVGAESLVTNYVTFPGSEIGGELSFDVSDSDYNQIESVTFKTK